MLERTICTGKPVTATMSQSGSRGYTKPVGITALMSSTPPQPCKCRKNATLRPTMNKPTYGTTSERMISVTPSRMSWTLLEPEDRNTSSDCFTTTTRNIPCFQFGTANTNSILWRGPKHTRTSSRKVSFHSKTQESIGTKLTPSSITSTKKLGTHSDSKPSARNPRKSSTSTTCSNSMSQTAGPDPRLPNKVDLMQQSPLTQNCWQLPCLTPLI